jgi:hypothetical protein
MKPAQPAMAPPNTAASTTSTTARATTLPPAQQPIPQPGASSSPTSNTRASVATTTTPRQTISPGTEPPQFLDYDENNRERIINYMIDRYSQSNTRDPFKEALRRFPEIIQNDIINSLAEMGMFL